MATLKKLKEDTLNITSKILKKDEDFLPISPEFIEDLKNKTLLENSALKLSISDYELMCNNKTILNMMAIALNKPKAKLKKFCKHITVFKENISKSPKSIANKINGINGPITNLPKEIRSTILDKFAEILPTKYVLLDWIDKDKLNWNRLSANPNAIDLLEENQDKIDWINLSINPNAIDLLKENQDKIDWINLSINPNAIDLLKDKIKYEKSLTDEELDESESKIDWEDLSSNPNAIELLTNNQDKIDWEHLSKNRNAIDLLKERIKYEKSLTNEELDELENKINWGWLSLNQNAINLLKANPNKIIWRLLSKNRNAIDLLKERIKYENSLTKEEYNDLDLKDRLNWNNLSLNPNAINLLEERIKYEKSLTDAQLDQLKNKIDWDYLSTNSNAIKLLKKNQDKIKWNYLSENPNAINLLEDRIKYEKSLTDAQLDQLKNKINWYWLSKNSNAIKLLKKNQDKIKWDYLSENPAIFKAV
jgi:hypothetical protein